MKTIKSNRAFLHLFQFMILIFLMVNYAFHDIPLISAIKVFLYQFFAWFVAGYAIFKLAKIQASNFAEVIAFSYAFGAISALVIYLVFMIPGTGFLLPVFTVVESALSIIYIYKTGDDIENYQVDIFSIVICLLFLFVYYILSTCAVSFVNTMPDETIGGTGYYVDWPFWAGNNIAFTKSFPSDSFRQTGAAFGYHFFSSILMAQVSLCTGVDINQISFYFSSILAGIIFVFSGYYFASRVLKRKLFVIILMCIVLFTDGGTAAATYTWHTNICPFGFDYGCAYGMMSIAVLAEILVNNKFKELFIPSIFFVAMTTGCKGPIGVVVLGAYGVAAISFLLRKEIKRGIISGCVWLASFVGVYYVFIRDVHNTEAAAGLQYIGGLGINMVVTKAMWIADTYNSLLSAYRSQGNGLLLKFYSVWLYVYRANRIVSSLLVIAVIALVWDIFKKHFDAFLYCFVLSSIVGILLSIYTIQSGGSQMYFMMAMFPMGSMAGMYAIERLGKARNNLKKDYLYKSVIIIVLCTLGLSLDKYYEVIIPKVREGIAVIQNRYTQEDYKAYYADSTSYEAFAWLKNNTDKNCVFAMDSFVDLHGKDCHMIAGIFSERYVWNEEKYVPDLDEAARRNSVVHALQTDTENALQQMRNEGVSYLVSQVSVDKVELGELTDNLNEVFRNEYYIIYGL
ncbi:MAG: hypothetical protein HFH68_01805 [Lachnospiraceae bacterium]|nr:hypothetical protein [Lachnospiraceae bacterium]